MIGRTLDDRYTITGRVGKGSMGSVYRARQNVMDRDVAIKILRQDRAVDDTMKARFFREARAQSVLHSPHTVTVFDFGQTSDEELYLAMELLEGESLGQRLTRIKRFAPADAIDIARQVLRSLGEAHAKGIIHRDLKPDNIFFARVVQGATGFDIRHDEIVKVLDFGIAKLTAVGGANVAADLNVVETQAGTVFGTPRYMSPEQAQGKPLDARTDLYSLGVMLYQMLAGRPPFTDTDAVVVMARHIRTNPKTLREVAPDLVLPPDLEQLVLKVLSKDPNDRPASAEAMGAALQQARENVHALTSGVRPSVGDLESSPISTDFGTMPAITPPPDTSASPPAAGSSSAMDTLGSSAYEAVDTGRKAKRRLGLAIGLAAAALVAILGVTRVVTHNRSNGHAVTTTSPQAAPQGTATTTNVPLVTPSALPSSTLPVTAPTDSASALTAPSGSTAVIELPDTTPTAAPDVAVSSSPPPGTVPQNHGSGGQGGQGGRRKPHPPHPNPDKPPSSYGLFE